MAQRVTTRVGLAAASTLSLGLCLVIASACTARAPSKDKPAAARTAAEPSKDEPTPEPEAPYVSVFDRLPASALRYDRTPIRSDYDPARFPKIPARFHRWFELLELAGVPSVRDCSEWVEVGNRRRWNCGDGTVITSPEPTRLVGRERRDKGDPMGMVPRRIAGNSDGIPRSFPAELDSMIAVDPYERYRRISIIMGPGAAETPPFELIFVIYARWAAELGYDNRARQLLENAESFIQKYQFGIPQRNCWGDLSDPELAKVNIEWGRAYCSFHFSIEGRLAAIPALTLDLYREAELAYANSDRESALMLMRRADAVSDHSRAFALGLARREALLEANAELLTSNPDTLESAEAVDYWLLRWLRVPFPDLAREHRGEVVEGLRSLGPDAIPFLRARFRDPARVPSVGHPSTIASIAVDEVLAYDDFELDGFLSRGGVDEQRLGLSVKLSGDVFFESSPD